MPTMKVKIDFIADIDLYNHEKPFAALASPGTVTVGEDQLQNLQWQTHGDIDIVDIRGIEEQFTLDECGFQIVKHPGQKVSYATTDELELYKQEIGQLLSSLLGAVKVHCYEARVGQLTKPVGTVADHASDEREC